MTPASAVSMIACGVAARSLGGEAVCGDAHAVVPFASGFLVAVVDGLGHGEEATVAAAAAVATLQRFASEPVIDLVRRCHEAVRRTRGVVLSLASFRADQMT